MSEHQHKGKVAVIGDRDSVMIFQALGFHTVYADDPLTIEKAIHRLSREGFPVIYITETAAAQAEDTINLYKTEPYPAIIPIPSRFGSEGVGMKGIQDNIEKAIGADIL
ncbi:MULTISPECIES: V-type ATP synthase subunit F [Eubacterium]|uniref:V/A-type H+-transporting ATPase subunit F n=2 Tax=Eubacterium TaxID=1730 RepID=A0A1H3ZL52_9FIRM|nr:MULTISPECIES: V-type ATP synthase subunit F [Eubacterium]MDD4690874.1 V-type ATP synthase subunit F [Eubacterium aggregans]MEA5074050.1 V-type ATP synthase subunit F [Eubacterium aggregans]SDX47628.1 V/A-type H+-transporting ATPase subunit F [Eubacterium barkeri]SEA23982.1 V/A-type H+-transporting ATPase subunit F [Eubacterium aggregans]